MSAPARVARKRVPGTFDPKQTKRVDAQADGVIEFAKRLRDWPLLEDAVAAKVDEQREFVGWWRDNVTVRHGKSGPGKSAPAGTLPMAVAEEQTRISNQQVSRWAKRLADEAAYRTFLFGAAWRKAMAETWQQDDRRKVVAGKRLKLPPGKVDTIIIDPPWPMQKIEREVRPNQDVFDYPVMSIEELEAFGAEVAEIAADDCHLFMWTTQKFLPDALKIVEAWGFWGFRYVLTMVWHKPGGFQPIGLPQYNCEFIVYGRCGSPKFIETTAFPCCFEAPRREHSRKPDEFYDLVRRVTAGPRIDIFSREEREGFAQFGDEVNKFAGGA